MKPRLSGACLPATFLAIALAGGCSSLPPGSSEQQGTAIGGAAGAATGAAIGGFVTADEITAMSDAGLTDSEILNRLRATGHVFELTEAERSNLLGNGVPRDVLNGMEQLNA